MKPNSQWKKINEHIHEMTSYEMFSFGRWKHEFSSDGFSRVRYEFLFEILLVQIYGLDSASLCFHFPQQQMIRRESNEIGHLFEMKESPCLHYCCVCNFHLKMIKCRSKSQFSSRFIQHFELKWKIFLNLRNAIDKTKRRRPSSFVEEKSRCGVRDRGNAQRLCSAQHVNEWDEQT